MSMFGFIIDTLHNQHVSVFHKSSSGRPYINQSVNNMKEED